MPGLEILQYEYPASSWKLRLRGGSEITQITIFGSLFPGNADVTQSSKIMYFGDIDSVHPHLSSSRKFTWPAKDGEKMFSVP